MAEISDAGLDCHISLITSHLADVKLRDNSFLDGDQHEDSQNNGEGDDSTLISKSFMLEELLDTGDDEASTLEVYKDILHEKINSKTKIPTPATANHKKRISIRLSPKINNNSSIDSKLPVSVTKKFSRSSPNKSDSIRSVSESPLKRQPRLKVFSKADDSLMSLSSGISSRPSDLTQKRRKHKSMAPPSKRLLSAPFDLLPVQRPLQQLSSPTSQSRLPSYLKQTTSSLKKVAPLGRENKENHQSNSIYTRLSSSSSSTHFTDKPTRRISHSGYSQDQHVRPSKANDFLTILQESQVPPNSKNDSYTLTIPKVRQMKKLDKGLSQRPSFLGGVGTHSTQENDREVSANNLASKRVTRSQTQADLNAALNNNTIPIYTSQNLRKTSASLDKRRVSTSGKSVRSSSITASRKIASVADLYKSINKSSLVKTWERVQNHRFATVEPIDPIDLKRHARYQLLNNYERGEILRRSQIFYVGDKRKPEIEVSNFNKNFGFDDKQGNYLVENGDHIQYRFRVLSKLGNGAFGAVVACNDYKQDRICAVKIVKNEMTCSLQAVSEVKILKMLAKYTTENFSLMQYFGHFHFRGHMCIATEYLPINLYQVLEVSNFKGFKMSVISIFATQILRALHFLHHTLNIIHCDLKPENLMLVSPYSFDLKLIDFGSAVLINEISYSYLQSRFYRAPEVTLGARYNEKIDIWSFSTILVELFTGVPIFPCENENYLMEQYLELLGEPDSALIQQLRNDVYNQGAVGGSMSESSLLWQIFTGKGEFIARELQNRTNGKPVKVSSRSFHSVLRAYNYTEDSTESRLLELFIDMISRCLVWDYSCRESAEELLSHEFLQNSIVPS